jgi:hypothetical protein
MMLRIAMFSLTLFTSIISQATGFKGSVTFTDAEKAAHVAALPVIMETAANCMQADLKLQHKFISTYGIAAFYGDRSRFSKMSTAEKRNEIASYGANPDLLNYMQPTSCVGMTRKCLAKGFKAGGQIDVWKQIVPTPSKMMSTDQQCRMHFKSLAGKFSIGIRTSNSTKFGTMQRKPKTQKTQTISGAIMNRIGSAQANMADTI